MDTSTVPSTATTQRRTKNQKEHLKRTLNPFMLWAREEQKRVCQGKGPVQLRNINLVLGKMWKTEVSAHEKQQWKVKVEQEKEQPKFEYPDYKNKARPKRLRPEKDKKVYETVELIIHMGAPVSPASPARHVSPDLPGSLASSVSPVHPASPAMEEDIDLQPFPQHDDSLYRDLDMDDW